MVKCRAHAATGRKGLTEHDVGELRGPPVESVEATDGAVVVHLSGELDLYNADELRDALVAVVETKPDRVVVDLGRVDFIDSTALAVLIEARKRLENERTFLVAAPGHEPRRTLEVTGMAQLFGLYETVDDALAARI